MSAVVPAFRLMPGLKVWIRNPYPASDESYREQWLPSRFCGRPVWVPAEVVGFSPGADSMILCSTLLQPRMQVRVSADSVLPVNAVTGLDDISEFIYLHEAAVLYSLTRRYLEGRPVTRAGPSVYLSVNPCRIQADGEGISTVDVVYMARFRARLSPRMLEALPTAQRSAVSLPPSVFEAADRAHTAALGDGAPQALLFLGETGSGKTEALKAALQYLVCIGPLAHAGVKSGGLTVPAVRAVLEGLGDDVASSGSLTGILYTSRQQEGRGGMRTARVRDTIPEVLQLSESDKEYCRRDAVRRRGPLGSTRNPWVVHPTPASSFSAPGTAQQGGTTQPPVALRSTDFYSDAAGPRAVDRKASTASVHKAGTAGGGGGGGYGGGFGGVPFTHKHVASTVNKVGRVLLAAQTVLEAFGCAATPSNANSSRFIRGVAVTFDGSGDVASARLSARLLDSRRVLGASFDARAYGMLRAKGSATYPGIGAGMPPTGRNFHIFYQLLAGAARETRVALQLGAQADYLCLQQPKWAQFGSGAVVAPTETVQYVHGVPLSSRSGGAAVQVANGGPGTVLSAFSTALFDGEELAYTVKAMEECELDPSTQAVMFRLLSAILIAGNVRFDENASDNALGPAGAAVVSTPSEVAILAELLGVEGAALSDALVKKVRGTVSSGFGANSGSGVSFTWRRGGEARMALDGLMVGLYERLFEWVVARLNAALDRAAGIVSAGGEALVDMVIGPASPQAGGAGGAVKTSSVTLVEAPGLDAPMPVHVDAQMHPSSSPYRSEVVDEAGSGTSSGPLPPVVVDVERLAGLDALVTGYAAERMHDAFLDACFRAESALYSAEGIDHSPPIFDDTARPAAGLVSDKRAGVMAALCEAATQPRATDAVVAAKIQAMQARSSAYVRPTIASSAGLTFSEAGRLVASPSASSSSTALTAFSEPGGVFLVSSAAAMQEGSTSGPVSAQGAGYDASLLFGARHSGGTVLYSAAGWLTAARNASGPSLHRGDTDLLQVLASSGNPVVMECLGLAPIGTTQQGVATRSQRSVRVGALDVLATPTSTETLLVPAPLRGIVAPAGSYGIAAVEAVDEVLSPLLQQTATAGAPTLFVRCLRPNGSLQPTFAEPALLHSQITHSAALHAVAARHTGFPAHLSFADFYERYVLIVHGQEDEADRQRKAAGQALAPRRLVFPPPRKSDVRELSRELLSTVAGHPVFAPIRTELRGSVQFGRSLVLMKAHVYDTLEALRDVRLATMDRQATRLQAVYRGCALRKRVKRVVEGAKRLQAGWLTVLARANWLAVRRAVIRIQTAFRRSIAVTQYAATMRQLAKLQGWIRAIGSTRNWRRIRKGLRQVHAMSRGFIIRCHVMRMLAAVVKLQATARMFIVRRRAQRYKNAIVRVVQAAWRGRRFRMYHEDMLAVLAERREVRSATGAATALQSLWRGATTRREYVATRMRVLVLQRWAVARLSRGRYTRLRAAAVHLQAFCRGIIVRKRVAQMRTLNAVGDELWRVHSVRKLELAELSRAAAEDAVLALPPALRAAVAASSGLFINYVAPVSGSGSAMAVLPPRVVQVSARSGPPGSDSGGAPHVPFTATALVDVDATSDTMVVHPSTLSRALLSIERELRACGTRMGGLALGSTHALVLTEGGQVYSWGFGDRGQTGHGRWAGEGAPKLLDALLSEKELLSAQEKAAPPPTASGSGRVTPSKEQRGGSSPSPLPPYLAMPLRVKSIAAGDEHSLALSETGKLFAWGNGRRGALGTGSWDSTCVPIAVRLALRDGDASLLPAPVALSAADGGGEGAAAAHSTSPAGGGGGDDLTRVVEVCAGANHSVALTSGGLVYTWGDGACLGCGVYSGTGDSCTPAPVRDLLRHRVRHITSGPAYVVVVTTGGDVYTWGTGKEGQLGHGEDGGRGRDGSALDVGGEGVAPSPRTGQHATPPASVRFRPRYKPALVEGFSVFDKHSRITSVSAGGKHVLALSSTGRVYAWGSNSHGQLGLGVPGPLPENVLRKAGVPLPTLPLADRLARAPQGGDGGYLPRPYVASPAWVWSLDQHHVTSATATGRGSAVLTDRKEVYAWGASYAPASLVDADAVLLRAYAVLRGVHLPPGVGAPATSAAPGMDAFPPVQLLESGRGPLELNIVAFPVIVPLGAVPGRTPKRLLSATSSTASVLAISYTQAPVMESTIKDTALARAVAPLTAAGASTTLSAGYSQRGVPLGGGAPPLAVLVAGALADIDTTEPLPGAARGAPVPPALASGLPTHTMDGVRVPSSPQPRLPLGKTAPSGSAPVASPAVALLTALVSTGKTPGASDRKAVQDAVYRGLMGGGGASPAAPPAPAGSAFNRVAPTPGGVGARGAVAADAAAQAVAAGAPAGASTSLPDTALPPAYVTALRLHPSVTALACLVASDPGACAALLNLSPDQLRAMTPRHVLMLIEHLLDLSGAGSPGRAAGRAAQRELGVGGWTAKSAPPAHALRAGLPLSPRPVFSSTAASSIVAARNQAETAAAMRAASAANVAAARAALALASPTPARGGAAKSTPAQHDGGGGTSVRKSAAPMRTPPSVPRPASPSQRGPAAGGRTLTPGASSGGGGPSASTTRQVGGASCSGSGSGGGVPTGGVPSPAQVAAATGMPPLTVRAVLSGGPTSVLPSTAQALTADAGVATSGALPLPPTRPPPRPTPRSPPAPHEGGGGWASAPGPTLGSAFGGVDEDLLLARAALSARIAARHAEGRGSGSPGGATADAGAAGGVSPTTGPALGASALSLASLGGSPGLAYAPLPSLGSPTGAALLADMPDLSSMDEDAALRSSLLDMHRRMEAAKMRAAAMAALQQAQVSSPSRSYRPQAPPPGGGGGGAYSFGGRVL